MFLIYNAPGVIFLLLGGLSAWTIKYVAWALGLDGTRFFVGLFVFALVAGGLDVAVRKANTFGVDSSLGLRTVDPSAGGHLFFVPIWFAVSALFVAFQLKGV